MKFAILTTNTAHHEYFIHQIASEFEIAYLVYENMHISFNYETRHSFELSQELYEREMLTRNAHVDIKRFGIAEHHVDTVNSDDFKKIYQKNPVDFALVFGCGRISQEIIDLFPDGLINVHRGISRYYRGLDSELWAAYKKDFKNIGVTLHYIDNNLDTGDILFEGSLDIPKNCKVHQLRGMATVLATEEIIKILSLLSQEKEVKRLSQTPGNYYSAMSSDEKEIAKNNFDNYSKYIK